jgi:hypothetical protein
VAVREGGGEDEQRDAHRQQEAAEIAGHWRWPSLVA